MCNNDRQQLQLSEYAEANSMFRYFIDLRFKRLSLMGTLNTALIAIIRFGPENRIFLVLWISVVAIAVNFFLMLFELRSGEYRKAYNERLKVLEKDLGFQLHTSKNLPSKDTKYRNKYFINWIYIIVILCWSAICLLNILNLAGANISLP